MTWSTKKLGEIAQIRMGETLIKKDLTGEGTPIYSADSTDEPWGYTSKNFLRFKYGTLVIGARGTIGSVKLPTDKIFTSTQTTITITPKSEIVSPKFLFYFLRRFNFSAFRERGSIPMLTVGKISQAEISLPSLLEQKKIVYVLDSIQEAVKVQDEIIERMKELKKAMMKKLFTEGTKEKSKIKIQKSKLQFKIQRWVKLSEVAKIERGKFAHRPRNDPAYYGGNIPFIQTSDVTLSNGHIKKYNQTLNKRGLSVSRIFPKGTIVITIAANIGYSAILDFDSAFPDSLIGITPDKRLDSEFLNYYLASQQKKMDEIAARGTQKNINIEFLKLWPVPLPLLPEQREIAEILQAIDQKIEIEKKKKELYEELFKTMLNKLMTRKIKANNLKFLDL